MTNLEPTVDLGAASPASESGRGSRIEETKRALLGFLVETKREGRRFTPATHIRFFVAGELTVVP